MNLTEKNLRDASLPSAILLVEDEPLLRVSMARGLSKLTNVDVLAAASFSEAVALLEARPPSLLISDINLPGALGLDLMGELNNRGINIPIIFITAFIKTYRSQIPMHPKVLVMEKPIVIGELREHVVHLLGPAGDAMQTPFGVCDYVQLSCLGGHSVIIDVEFVIGSGRIVIHDGAVWSAVDQQGCGAGAFIRLALATDVVITCSPMVGEPGLRTITEHWEFLVLESARVFDESQKVKNSTATVSPGASVRLEATVAMPIQPESPLTFDELWSQGVEALLNHDFLAAIRAFKATEALRPGEPRVLANLARLKEMGYSDSTGGEQ